MGMVVMINYSIISCKKFVLKVLGDLMLSRSSAKIKINNENLK